MTHSASSIPDNPQGKPYVDFLVLLPLEDELLEFTRHFPSVNNVSTEIAWRHFVDPVTLGTEFWQLSAYHQAVFRPSTPYRTLISSTTLELWYA